VQGDISLSSIGLLAAKKIGLNVISYLPMAHSRSQRKERFAGIKDWLLSSYYKMPDKFITISEAVRRQIKSRDVLASIKVIHNGVDFSALKQACSDKENNSEFFLDERFTVVLPGRIEFKQKGHDVLLDAIVKNRVQFNAWRFLIVGDGPDLDKLKHRIDEFGLEDIVQHAPWQDNMNPVFCKAQLLVMPSRFEGVPVTALEAMYLRKVLVASDIDEFRELLPHSWLFEAENPDSLAKVLLKCANDEFDTDLEFNFQKVTHIYSVERQHSEFKQYLLEYAESRAGH
jgi:glycosyltransferase involved in cell wall biosynthesis